MGRSELVTAIASATAGLAPPPAAEDIERMAVLLQELERWNRRVNLTAIRDLEEMITGHLCDSLVVQPLLEGDSVLDVGTGPGFPGLPLAIVEPGCTFELLDSSNKKIQFVNHVIGLLGLGNVKAVRSRAEDYAPGHRFGTVIARAVATLSRLLGMAGHHVGEDGVFIALKGRYPEEELDDLPASWEAVVTPLSVPGLEQGSRHAVLMRRK